MKYVKALSISAAVVVTAAATFVPASPALGKTPRIVVDAPVDALARHIAYADLNLASPEGERTLSNRVESGVNGMCVDGAGGNDGSFLYKDYMMRCSGAAWRQARPQIALAVQRAHEIAATGTSGIAAAAVTISLPK